MSLDVYLYDAEGNLVYERNITHNLNKMADAAGIYGALWRPDENGITTAKQVADAIRSGVADLAANGKKYRQYDSPNGWGLWIHFVPFCLDYLDACDKWPDARVEVSR